MALASVMLSETLPPSLHTFHCCHSWLNPDIDRHELPFAILDAQLDHRLAGAVAAAAVTAKETAAAHSRSSRGGRNTSETTGGWVAECPCQQGTMLTCKYVSLSSDELGLEQASLTFVFDVLRVTAKIHTGWIENMPLGLD